jgi:hypothetical protein
MRPSDQYISTKEASVSSLDWLSPDMPALPIHDLLSAVPMRGTLGIPSYPGFSIEYRTEWCEATIILPAYNEAEALPNVLESLFAVLDDHHEVIVVDDGSTDHTALIASSFPCKLIRQPNQGKGAAVRTGIRAASGQYIIIMDADNTYPAEAVLPMIALLKQYDFVRGSRKANKANMPLVNRLGNRIFDWFLRIVHGLEGGDLLTGLYGLRREALEMIDFTADGFDMEVEIGIKARVHQLRTTGFPIDYHQRLGEKKLNAWQDGWRILRRLLSMALLYNPGLTFVLPGVLLWSLASLLTFIMSRGTVATPLAVLSLHSFIVSALATTAGFQLIVFGIAAALYGMENGVPQKPWLRTLSSPNVRRGASVVGGICAAGGLGLFATLAGRWLLSGGPFYDTRGLVLASVLLSWGMEMVLTVMFISIFASRIEKKVPARQSAPERLAAEVKYVES